MRPSRARSVRPIRGATRRRKAPVAPSSFGYSIQVACLAIWYGIISSSPASPRPAITASPGAARRAGNGRPRADPGKTRALHATHLSTGDRLWSSFPKLRAMATITHDTLDWYGWDEDGAGVHDIIGTRCDPYTNLLLKGTEYHHCCHSNLTRALSTERNLPLEEAEVHVHDVMNVFMCTGYTRDTHQYFMKASPVRPGDFIEFSPRLICWLRFLPVPGATAAPVTPTIVPNVIRSKSRSIGRARAR